MKENWLKLIKIIPRSKNLILFLVCFVTIFSFSLRAAQAKIIAQIVNNNGLVQQQIFDSEADLNLFIAHSGGTLTGSKIIDIPDTASPDELKQFDQSAKDFNAQQQKIFQDSSNSSSSIWSIFTWLPDKIFRVSLAVLYIILWLVYSVAYGLVYLAESILKLAVDPNLMKTLGGFTTAPFVKNVAQIVANLCNMLYLFVLLYIAFGTMLGKSNVRTLLIKLVIAALLTNFGLVLAGVVIDFTQVIMYSIFTPEKIQAGFSPGTDILQAIQAKLGIGSTTLSGLWDFATKIFGWNTTGTLFKDVLNLCFLIFVALALVVTLLTIALLLMIRIIALWVLLILTPIAFLFSTLPQTEKYWSLWLENLTKYAFTGPILVFFLWLAKKMADNFQNLQQLNLLGGNLPNQNDLKYAFYALFAQNFVSFFQMLVLVVVIWAGILIANRFGIKGTPSLNGLLKGVGAIAGGIPWYAGRAATWASYGLTGVTSFFSQRRSAQANLARSVNDTKKAEELEEKSKWWSNKEKQVKEQKDRAIKTFSVMNPFIVKKQFAAWWNKHSQEHMEQSEASVDEFGRDLARTVTFGKLSEGWKAKMSTEAKINNLDNTFKEKYKDLEKARADLSAAKTAAANNRLDADIQNLADVENRIDLHKAQISVDREQIRTGPAAQRRTYEQDLRSRLKDVKMLNAEKIALEESIKTKSAPIEEFKDKRDKTKQELSDLGSSLAEMSTTDDNEKKAIEIRARSIAFGTRGTLASDYSFVNALNTKMGPAYAGSNSLAEKAKKLSKETAVDLMTEHIWQKDKKEKEVKEKLKELEDKRYTFEQLEDMAKSGYGDAIMRTAIFRRLASSPKNFGNLLEKTLKDYDKDEKKALDFLKQRYSEDELTKAFAAAEIEAKKSNNLFSMGWLKHDQVAGKLRFIRGNERQVNLANFAKGMTPNDINNINPQSFKDPEAIRQMAQNFDWVKLARNPRFIDSMSQNTRKLFRDKQTEFEGRMGKDNRNAFRKILKV